MFKTNSSLVSAFLLTVSACGGGGASETTSTSDEATDLDDDVGNDVGTDADDDVDTDGGECSNCPEGTSCVEDQCEPLDCSSQPCPGLSYCDLATQTCQPGCALDSQCENGICDLATHSCECAEGFVDCEGECISVDQICDSKCGNGQLDPGEVCDGETLDGASCESLGFVSGALACLPDCSGYDTSNCMGPGCGDGILHDGEECDGASLDGNDCMDFGFEVGTLGCDANCTFDTSACDFKPLPDSGIYSACQFDSEQCGPSAWDICDQAVGICTTHCMGDSDCAPAEDLGGNAVPKCLTSALFPDSQYCHLTCAGGLDCPGGTECSDHVQWGEICQT